MNGIESAPGEPMAPACRRLRAGFIVGPTGTGKSELGFWVAERLGAEVVNADSRLFYRGLDIGAAKPDKEKRRQVPHHLVDIREPDQALDVAEFRQLARRAIANVTSRGKPVLVVGGSGLYLKVLRKGIVTLPAASAELRQRLYAAVAAHGTGYLHDRLRQLDPVAAGRTGYNDLYRIVRALEVFELTGGPMSAHQESHGFRHSEYESLTVGLMMERRCLYENINRRFEQMLALGMVEEVRTLMAAGYKVGEHPLCAIGYRHLAAYLRGELGRDEAIELAKRDTRRLAKRQLTWFRADPEIVWVDAHGGREQALKLFAEFFARGFGASG